MFLDPSPIFLNSTENFYVVTPENGPQVLEILHIIAKAESFEDGNTDILFSLRGNSTFLVKNQLISRIFWSNIFAETLFFQEVYLEPSQTFKINLFAKIFNGFHPLTVFAQYSILHVCQNFEHDSEKTLENLPNLRCVF